MHFTQIAITTPHDQTWNESRVEHTIKDLLAKFDHHREFTVFINASTEIHPALDFGSVDQLTKELKKIKPAWRLFLILDSYYQDQTRDIQFDVEDTLTVDYCLYLTMRMCKVHGVSSTAYRWNKHQKKFLCLTGKPLKLNRIGLLYKLSQHGLLDPGQCVWSLLDDRHDETEIDKVRLNNQFPELTANTIRRLFDDFASNPDSVEKIPGFYENLDPLCRVFDCYKYDVRLFTSTKFSVVSETSFSAVSRPEITEKTWKTILNFHPFIIAGDTNTCAMLNRMGFVTYENFLPRPDYDSVENNLERLETVVTNTNFWLNNIDDHATEIQTITAYNSWILHLHYERNEKLINDFIHKHNLNLSIDDLIVADLGPYVFYDYYLAQKQQLQQEHFQRFYNHVRDVSWPDCRCESEFDGLPEHVKKELIEVFGYVPP
jgi:hypothetical protein